jgi:SAM-dependent methyltransferase
MLSESAIPEKRRSNSQLVGDKLRATGGYHLFLQAIANIKWKSKKRLRALLRRNPSYLAAGMQEALELISTKSKRSDWPPVCLAVDRNDMMYEGHATGYFSSGYSALFCVRQALESTGKASVSSILDFGCGHGRVLRSLAAQFPDATLTAMDVNRRGVAFCAKKFGAKPIYSNTDFSNVVFHEKFDLIWVGSLFTHLYAERWPIALELLRSVLTEDGLLIFSTHGRDAERRLRDRQVLLFNLELERIEKALESYDKFGFGYSDYRRCPGYGVSLSSPQWVTQQLNKVALELQLLQEKGWDDFQDVWAVRLKNS